MKVNPSHNGVLLEIESIKKKTVLSDKATIRYKINLLIVWGVRENKLLYTKLQKRRNTQGVVHK